MTTQVETRNLYVTISDKINTVEPTGKKTIILQLEFNRGHDAQSNTTDEICPWFMTAEV
jgi:hypothetical protein